MYLKLPGYQKRIIKDLYEVYLPPVPPRNQILFSDLKKSDQYWRRTPLPKFYDERRPEELARQEKEQELVDEGIIKRVKHFDPVLETYRRKQWEMRTYGVWFMNNGTPTYLTGTHWFYLQWSKFDHQENDGYPIFYDPQLDRFYFRQLCLEDPFCLGYLMVGPRGGGKTTEEVAAMAENMTKPPHRRYAAIQSKNKDDAEQVIFQEKMVPMFNALPDFFKPEFSHGTDPKDGFTFRRRSQFGKKSKKVKHGDDFELGSTITCYPPQNKTLDGKTISDLMNDEIGKLKPEKDMDAYTRNTVNVKTVFRNQRKVGIIRATTTVEEMEQGGDECLEIWEESDPRKRDPNGYTISKLYKYFISGLDTQTQFADKYGRIPYEQAYRAVQNEREPVKDDNIKLSSLMRKTPLTEEEAFITNQAHSTYDVMILSKRLSELTLAKADKKYRRYHAEWVNGVVDGDVELIPHPEGNVTLFYDPDVYWSKTRKLLNACPYTVSDSGKKLWIPVNNDFFRSATDPIRFVMSTDKRASKMGGHGFMKFIPDLDNGKHLNDWISHNLLWEYHDRHNDTTEDYENMIKLMRYFGHSIMPEANAGEFIKHLYSRGYQKFVIIRKNFNPEVLLNKHSKNAMSGENAVSSNTEVIESYVQRTKAFIRRHGHRIPSIPLIKQLLKFDPKNPTIYDLAVSFSYGILALEADLDDYFNTQKHNEMVENYFNTFDISGNQSRMIYPISTPSEESNDDNISDFDDPSYLLDLLRG
jgi:hypothetical protein